MKFIFFLFFLLFILFGFINSDKIIIIQKTIDYEYSLGKIKDTFFTTTQYFIEVNLKTQKAILHDKSDTVITFPISSGNPNISEGIETPEGIFTVQNKNPLAISKQFNDAKLFNWIGINGNVGFHGLEGKKYYTTLGKRASSHGCIRISLEDGKIMYDKVKTGIPVIIHNGNPARVISFIDSIRTLNSKFQLITKNTKADKKIIDNRLNNIYKGNGFIDNLDKFYFDGSYILKGWKFDVGDYSKVPEKQKEPILGPFCFKTLDNLTTKSIVDSILISKIKLKR